MQQQFVPNVIKTLNAEEKFYVIRSVRFITFHIWTDKMYLQNTIKHIIKHAHIRCQLPQDDTLVPKHMVIGSE